jgi:ABC-2 type transport system ATP-binding protein
MPEAFLDVRDVRKSYGAVAALRGVSFQVHEGEIFGLLGPNGAGKTTLLSIVAGLLEADGGQVAIAGSPLRPSHADLRRLIGIVPQELALYGELTAAENLRFFGELYGVRGGALEERTRKILEATGLEDRARQRVATFSGGMQRRLNLGAALVHKPRLLLLDEPTAGVDAQSRHLLFEEIRRLHRAGITIVYTSHYMEEVQALCTRIGIIDHGRLIACDSLERLLQLLPGKIVAHAAGSDDGLRERIGRLDGVSKLDVRGDLWELSCHDVPQTALRVLELAKEAGAQLQVVEMERPNLERVFLHLTGRGLRD